VSSLLGSFPNSCYEKFKVQSSKSKAKVKSKGRYELFIVSDEPKAHAGLLGKVVIGWRSRENAG
jgi:hypothetical protein